MATRIRTLNFLPEIFQTTTNSQFLNATLDQLVDQPNTQRIQGYVGSKFGYSINAKDYYVTEPTKTRTDYQLEPGVVFTTDNDITAKDFISYPGISDALKLQGSLTEDQNRLFNSQIYAWDSFTNLDPLVNFNQYYWIPEGPERVVVNQQEVSRLEDYIVGDTTDYYTLSPVGTTETTPDPTITLLRGGTYTFAVNQNSQFWIQGAPGVTGLDPNQTNISTRDVYGVDNNGAEQGLITFNVPFRNAQNEYILPGNISVDVVSNISFQQLNGTPVTGFAGIDGITQLENLTVLFYDTGYPNELGYVSNFYGTENDNYDVNTDLVAPTTITITNTTTGTNYITCNSTSNLTVGQTITFSGLPFGNINQYQPGTPLTYSVTSAVNGEIYYISDLGTTNWLSVGAPFPSDSDFVAYISGNVLYVSSIVGGSIEVGQQINGTGVTAGTKITQEFINVLFSGYIDDGAGSPGDILTVTDVVSSGALGVGSVIAGPGLPVGLSITAILSGSGGVGTYQVSQTGLLYATNTLQATAPAGYTTYQIDTFHSPLVASTPMLGYDISVGKMFTANGPGTGTGIITPYAPSIYFVSSIVNSTTFTIATELNPYVMAPYIEVGKTYIISYVGSTDFTLLGAPSNTIGVQFTATQVGTGTGTATELTLAGDLTYGTKYKIITAGNTSWVSVGASNNLPGTIFVATGPGSGTGTALPVVDVTLSTDSGTMTGYTNQGLYEEGYYTEVNQHLFKITYIGEPGSQVIRLVPYSLIPNKQKITAKYGNLYINRSFFRTIQGEIEIIPYISAVLDVLYYQDGSDPNKYGVIRLIESNALNTLYVDEEIVGHKSYTATNGVVFTNGLKVTFQGSVYPLSYLNNEYYVEGVGTAIELIPVSDLIAPEPFTGSILIPWDSTGYGVTNFEGNSYIPVYQDYITIARNSINKNAWSRSNRWFHIGVIEATAKYNNNPDLLTLYATEETKAKRPIIEFYPNLKLFNSGTTGKSPIDFIDFRTTDAFSLVAGKENYYPDVEVYTAYTATIQPTNYSQRVATSTNGSSEYIICDSTTGFNVNDTVVFDGQINQVVLGGLIAKTIYYIISVIDSTTFMVSDVLGGLPVDLSTATGSAAFVWQRSATATNGTNGYITCNSTLGFRKNDTVVFYNAILNNTFGNIEPGITYYISEVVNGTTFTMSESYDGPIVTLSTGTSSSAAGARFFWTPRGTQISISTADITSVNSTIGSFQVAQYIADSESLLPNNTYITDIQTVGSVTNLTVYWGSGVAYEAGTTTASLVACPTPMSNFALFDGARVVFANDTNANVRNKIYISRFTQLTPGSSTIITLSEAADGEVLPYQQTVAFRGYNYQGFDFYYDSENWLKCQQKTIVNQPPLFDVFDKNNISFGDKTIYNGSSFTGSKLFSYGIGSGINDYILGFPLRYSSINNSNDISFDVNINTDTFTYVDGLTPITQQVNTGYVFNYDSYVSYNREIGWQTTVSPSVQYQLFSFNFDPSVNTAVFTCDIAPNLETNWPTILVYNNNNFLTSDYYTVSTTNTTTTVTLNTDPTITTVIQILLLSTQVSNNAYYTVPLNLSNNPLNEDLTTISVGELRLQYQSICINNQDVSGLIFGNNNFRDLGNLVPYATQIIQNSASLVLPGAFLRKQDHNLFNALAFNNIEYIKYKTLLVNTASNIITQQTFNPSQMLDMVLDVIASTKTSDQPFFWSDMLPNKAVYITNTYKFANSLDTSVYPLSRVYDFSTANYYGVLVYLSRTISGTTVTKQMIKDVDYTISETTPSLTITLDLLPNDVVTIKEYNQTYGSYAPNTPTKLGLYPKYIPEIVLDTDYQTPTYFIRGHDGSYNKLYGDYNETFGVLIDFRDQVLFEFEKRVYNNLKISNTIPIQVYEVEPGFFRKTEYTIEEFLDIYSKTFLDWVGTNRVDYKTQLFNKTNQLTYNYYESGNKINKEPILQGYWRGVYDYYYDTFTPNTTPWEMLGYSDQPTWWESRYGSAPYTSDNIILWGDLAAGYDYNNGNPRIIPWAVRPQLLEIIPVDSAGDLVSPFVSIVGNYVSTTFQRDWKIGDIAPTELSYRRSSSYPFDLMRILALTKPAQFFNLAVDVDKYKYSEEFNQYLVNDRSHLKLSDIDIYGNGTAATSYINWIVDYEKQLGLDATANIKSMLNSLDVRLVYRLAGFSDKSLLKFFVEKGNPNNTNASLLIPDESYQILLYDNIPFDKIVYSSIIVQLTENGNYAVYGNSQSRPVFVGLVPLNDGNLLNLKIENLSVKLPVNYSTEEKIIPYGTTFYSVQEVASFIKSVGAKFTSQGMAFDYMENEIEVNWDQMVAEFLYYAQTGWEVGTIVTLNPAAKSLKINKDSYIVQPLTLQHTNFVLNDNLYPILLQDLNVIRENTMFNVIPLSAGDAISYGQFNISNFENGIVFNNLTLFDDVIYNLVTGLRQQRIIVNGWKTAEWNGTIDAQGFILNQDNIKPWTKEAKYTKGEIVKYKNKYWTALKIIQPGNLFNEQEWKQTDYDTIQKGLLPNPSNRAYESTLYYDTNKANLENDGDLLSFSLIGYRPREYMSLADLSDITQINVYQNLIKEKGTPAAANAFQGANLPQGGIKYDIYENWAIKAGEFGGVLNSNYVEILLNEKYLYGNPATVSLTNGDIFTSGAQQQVPLNTVFNYGRPLTSPNILPTVPSEEPSKVFPDAGYVNFEDVKMSTYYYSGISTATNASGIVVPITELLVRDYVWIANYKEQWEVVTPTQLGQVIFAKNNLNNTVTIQFAEPHNLTQYQTFAIVNFNTAVDGYYIATLIPTPHTVIINLSLDPTVKTISSLGVAMKFQNQRVATPADINSLPLLDSEFIKNTVWVDTNSDGSWAVYRKSINYTFENEILKNTLLLGPSVTFGSAVAVSNNFGYLISDPGAGGVYRYTYNALTNAYAIDQVIVEGTSFGSSIVYAGDLVVIIEPDNFTWRVYRYIKNKTVDSLVKIQESVTFCDAVTVSEDQRWIYLSVFIAGWVVAYHKTETQYVAGSFIAGEVYTIQTVGTTDFTLIGSPDNNIGTTFVATDVGTGTGIATQTSYVFAQIITVPAIIFSSDEFGYSLSTNYDGSVLAMGIPGKDFDINTKQWGITYLADRLVQTIEATYTSVPTVLPLIYPLAWSVTPPTAISGVSVSGSVITVSGTISYSVNTPIIFKGTNGTTSDFNDTGIMPYTVYYVYSASGTSLEVKESVLSNTAIVWTSALSVAFDVYIQTQILDIYLNGTLVDNSNYGIIGSNFVYTTQINAGDIVKVSSAKFVATQLLYSPATPRIGVRYGNSVDFNTFGNELLIGAPFEISTNNAEGAVYRYTDGGRSFGIVIGTSTCYVTMTRKLMINGYLVTLNTGYATDVANTINNSGILNIQATATNDGKLIISLIDSNLSIPNQKLIITSDEYATITELGFEIYSLTQTVSCPHPAGSTQFGTVVKFNEYGSFVTSAPTGTRYEATTFDFVDDEIDDDTVFDHNTTQFIDQRVHAGAAYMFDYLGVYNESLDNLGQYVYAQSTNATNEVYGEQPYYGLALDFNNNKLLIGTPTFRPGVIDGQVVVYENNTAQTQDWSVYRKSVSVVDISKISTIQIFDRTTNNTLINLDYIDPLQGKILGAARENIDFISNSDPARYNVVSNNFSTSGWGAEFEGMIWFDTSTTKFINYHQNDLVYNTKYWGRVFPGSQVDVYTWISSPVLPVNYIGPGTVYNNTLYATQYVINSSGQLVPVYYYWVKNTNIVFTKAGKTLADSIISAYIANPANSGISYFAPLLPNTFGIYNSGEYIQSLNSILSLNFTTGESDDVAHNLFDLIRTNYADDFLPGLPTYTSTNKEPESLYAKMIDSFGGTDKFGNVVPDPFLPKAVQSGILDRPKQSFFLDRLGALKNYMQFANELLLTAPFSDLNSTFVYKKGNYFDTTNYWEFVNYWAPGYDNSTKATIQVPYYADLSTLSVDYGTIATVAANGIYGLPETYIYTQDSGWVRIGVTNGTLQIKSSIWDYANNGIGFGNNFYDTVPFDSYPSEETKYLIRALNEEVPESYNIYRNRALISMFEYIQAETIENQNYLTWLNKTSLVDVSHTIRELLPYQTYKSDNQDFLAGYINEVKPFHVVIKDFLFKYTGTEVFEGNISDFDLPSQYSTKYQEFISPELVYANQSNEYQYLPTSSIWNDTAYNQWFNNYGLNLGGQNGYLICSLATYISLNAKYFFVDNSAGLPSTGELFIGDEIIGYTEVDRTLNIVSGLVRGVNNTPISTHVPGTNIYIDLPGVIVLNQGRGYISPPRIIAYTDPVLYPAPRRAAILKPIMAGGKVTAVTVVDPGDGYVVTPTIKIDPALVTPFSSEDVNINYNILRIYSDTLRTGDIVQYNTDVGSVSIGGLENGQWYYINVLESAPLIVLALYTTYNDAINDLNRVDFITAGSGTHTLSEGARAVAVVSSTPTRENITTLRYDRTSYNPSVVVWREGEYYGAYYAGLYNNTLTTASSSIKLESSQPPIDAILASAQGVSFEIVDVQNKQSVEWSSFDRDVFKLTNFGYGVVRLTPKAFSFVGTGSTSGNVLTILSVSYGYLSNGTYIYDDIDPSTFIVKQLTGTPGGIGTYEISNSYFVLSVSTIKGFKENTSGTTLGMYVGMPVKFNGLTGDSGITTNVVYYVAEILNQLDFAIATSGPPYTPISFDNTYTVGPSGLKLYTAEVTNNAVLTVYYPGITTVTNTTAQTNAITVPLNLTGSGGTNNFYIGMPVAFTGNVFGNIIENDVYYINGIIDNQNFTVSAKNDAFVNSITETIASTNTVVLDVTNDNYAINEPIIFSNLDAVLSPANTFGGLVSGTTYYVVGKVDTNKIQVSTSINGSVLSLSNDTPVTDPVTGLPVTGNYIISQKNAYQLTTASGAMTLNINLPVSPGQINGQLFDLYKTSGQYPNQVGTIGDLVQRTITATLANVNRITFNTVDGGLDNLYIRMPLVLENNQGGLATLTTYYIRELGTTKLTSNATTSSGLQATFTGSINGTTLTVTALGFGFINLGATIVGTGIASLAKVVSQTSGTTGGAGDYVLSVSSPIPGAVLDGQSFVGVVICNTNNATDALYVNMPVTFTGAGMGGVNINQEYYVACILEGTNGTQFALSNVQNGEVVAITNGTGTMYVNGDPWITVNTTVGDPEIALTTDVGTNTFTQSPLSNPSFDVSYIMGGYRVIITNAASGFAVTNTITIQGSNFGGTSKNDLTLTVNSIDTVSYVNYVLTSNGSITNVICSGTVPGSDTQYYLKVISPTELEVYTNPLLTVPVSGIGFSYTGILSTTVTGTTDSLSFPIPNLITVDSTSGFNVNDAVVFTGNVAGNLSLGATYYILDNANFTATTLQVSTTPNGSVVTLTNSALQSFTMAKSGDYAVLPEPFYFNQSIVKYNDQIYVCVISNNDDTFVPTKWQLLTSGSRRINGLDRIIGYYQPTDDMPGIDIGQLVTGTRYPNSIYLGNAFQPDQQFELDTILASTTFYPTQLNMVAVSNRKTQGVIAVLNTTEYSGYAISNGYVSGETMTWEVKKLDNYNLNITNIITTESGKYIITTANYPNNIVLGTSTDIVESDLIWKSILTPSTIMNDVCEYNNLLVAVGDTIIVSIDDGLSWTKVKTLSDDTRLHFELKSITPVSLSGFTGYVAVGSGQFYDYSTGLTNIINGNSVFYSTNGYNWTKVTPFTYHAFSSVATNGTNIIAVGENNVIYYSLNGANWTGVTETNVLGTTYLEGATFTGSIAGDVLTVSAISSGTINLFSKITVGAATNTYIIEQLSGTAGDVGTYRVSISQTVGSTTMSYPITNNVNLLSVNYYSLGDRVEFYGTPFGGLQNNTTYYITGINQYTSSVQLSLDSLGLLPVTVTTSSPINLSLLTKVLDGINLIPTFVNLNDIYYSQEFSKYITVGNNGFIFESADGLTWSTLLEFQTTSQKNLYGIIDTETESVPYVAIVGNNNDVVTSINPVTSWTEPTTTFTRPEQTYNIQGDAFTAGYGPEELVPGVVSDNITLIVNTRPGTNWPAVEYEHVGYKVISLEITPTTYPQLVYSFANTAQAPSQIRVSKINRDTFNYYSLYEIGLYEGIDYTTNWINKTVTLNTTLTDNELLRIDVYEVGNGDQLVKSNTDIDPIRYNQSSEWYEIYLNCNYSASIFNGGGVIRPGYEPKEVLAFATDGTSNSIYCVSVKDFILNDPIKFQGGVFGNVQEDTQYFVKTISYASKTITISASFNNITGTAGPTVNLTTATGNMYAIIQTGTGSVWADPLVFHNGTKLVSGITGTVTKMQSNNNTLTVNSTIGLNLTISIIPGNSIVFSSTMFGNVQGGILGATEIVSGQTYRIDSLGDTDWNSISTPLTRSWGLGTPVVGDTFESTNIGSGTGTVTAIYYVYAIYDDNQFSITSTNGGSVKSLTDATGGAYFMTNHYSFGLQPNGIQATLMFAYPYDATVDFIAYTVFGETEPAQYGGTLPECQTFIGDGSTYVFDLDNYNGGTNPENAIVEINGLRITPSPSNYVIDDNLNNITFNSITLVPGVGDVVAVTMYDLTERQYFSTNTYTGKTVSSITNIQNTISPAIAQLFVDQTIANPLNYITCSVGSNTSKLVYGQPIQFYGTTMGGIQTDGTVYFVRGLPAGSFVPTQTYIIASVGTTDFTLIGAASNTPGVTFVATGAGTGTGEAFSTTQFRIADADGNIVTLSNDTGSLYTVVGGQSTTRITTLNDNNLNTDDLVRIDGVLGSVQLNNNLYYVHKISNTQFDIYYFDPNNPTKKYDVNGDNNNVTNISSYVGGGFTWVSQSFILQTTTVTDTNVPSVAFPTNGITATDVTQLVIGTPIIFMESGVRIGLPTIGGIITGETYYIKAISVDDSQFTISETRDGTTFAVSSDTGTVIATQWNQTNVDRLWVTRNGERIPSSSLTINPGNDIGILSEINIGDEIVITSMMPSSTPDDETYLMNINQLNQAVAYKTNYNARTWITHPLGIYDPTMIVANAKNLTEVVLQTSTVPAATDGLYYIGLIGNRNLITGLVVYNQTKGVAISSNYYNIELFDLVPTLVIESGTYISQDDVLEIEIYQGNTLFINGEQIRFSSIDIATNTISGLERGVNGTGGQLLVPENTEVYGLLPGNKLSEAEYNQTWNPIPGIYNVSKGDPLQIANSSVANFLKPSPTRTQLNL